MKIYQKNLENIRKAYNITQNVSEILKIENTPDLKKLFTENSFQISDIFKLRHLSNTKYFRKWINKIGENANSAEVTEEYLNQIAGKNKFLNTTKGKFIKNTFLYGATSGLGYLIGGPLGGIVGATTKPIIDVGLDYSLGLLEEFVLDGILDGKNPKSFIDELKKQNIIKANNYS